MKLNFLSFNLISMKDSLSILFHFVLVYKGKSKDQNQKIKEAILKFLNIIKRKRKFMFLLTIQIRIKIKTAKIFQKNQKGVSIFGGCKFFFFQTEFQFLFEWGSFFPLFSIKYLLSIDISPFT